MGNSKLGKHEEEFESELDELISGISKIKNTSKLFSKGNVDSDSDDKAIADHSKEQDKFKGGEAAELSTGGSVVALPGIIYFEF